MKLQIFIYYFTICQILLPYIRADLPVHCLKSQTHGKWKFDFTEPKGVSALENRCEHDVPDLEKTSFKAMEKTFNSAFSISLRLLPNGCVEYLESSEKSHFFRFNLRRKSVTNSTSCTSGLSAAWTMVYDEGFEIRYRELKMFTFSFYSPSVSGRYESNCAKTCVGWYRNTKTNAMGCFRGEMLEKNAKISYINDQTDQLNVVEGVVEQKQSKPIFKTKRTPRFKSLTQSKFGEKLQLSANFKEHVKIVNRLNSISKSHWVADENSPFKDMSIRELNRLAGKSRNKEKISSNSRRNDNKIQYKKAKKVDVSDLPKSLNWEKYLPEPGQQGSCGSCYAISTLKMLESRLKIKENINSKISEKHAVECSYYNQGCEGGYSFLLGRFGEEQGFIDQSCTYTKNANEACEHQCGVYKIKDYWYIGGSYGECDERKIMEEIMKNGPVVLSFEPDYTFMLYKTGIYHKPGINSYVSHDEQKPEWYKVDHSVLCYGWGEENGEKYWLLMNSWGKIWGENGMFKMRRGQDELGIEFIGEAAIPYSVKGGGTNQKT